MPPVLLIHKLPKAGFTYRNLSGTTVTNHAKTDAQIKRAIQSAGLPLSRPAVTALLVAAFETLAVTLQAAYVPGSCDIAPITAVYEAIDITHRAASVATWAAGLEPSVFCQLVLGIRAARRVSLKELGRGAAEPGSWAGRLARAVDGFDEALYKRGWSGANELRALEGGVEDGDEERIRLARTRVSAGQEDNLCDRLEGMGFGGDEGDEEEVEIITERGGGAGWEVEMMDVEEAEGEKGKEEKEEGNEGKGGEQAGSMEPYFNAEGF